MGIAFTDATPQESEVGNGMHPTAVKAADDLDDGLCQQKAAGGYNDM